MSWVELNLPDFHKLPDPAGTLKGPPANLHLRVDSQALASNWRALSTLSGRAEAGAAVKADAYGLGVDHVVPVLAKAGARHFFLAHWSEIPAVVGHVKPEMVSVLHGVMSGEEAAFARAVGVRPVINSLRQAKIWSDAGGGPCHLMMDSGINRLGLSLADLSDPLLRQLEVEIFMSHLASADEDVAQNEQQLTAFKGAIASFPSAQFSLCNSAGIALGADYHFDITRPGIALYGGIVRDELKGLITQVAYPEAAIIQTRMLKVGDMVGYNATWRAEKPTPIAVVSLGYADGILRCWGADEGADKDEGSTFLHQGRKLPFLGRVSMDMIVVDCTAASDLSEGDLVELPYSLPETSKITKLSQYELLTSLGGRFSR